MWNDLENEIISYANDTTLYTEVAVPSDRINFANSLNRDIAKIQSWSSTWGMKLDLYKIHSITISYSRKTHPPHPHLTLCGLDLEVSTSLELLGITTDDKLTFEKHIRNIVSSITQKNWYYLRILQFSWQ